MCQVEKDPELGESHGFQGSCSTCSPHRHSGPIQHVPATPGTRQAQQGSISQRGRRLGPVFQCKHSWLALALGRENLPESPFIPSPLHTRSPLLLLTQQRPSGPQWSRGPRRARREE